MGCRSGWIGRTQKDFIGEHIKVDVDAGYVAVLSTETQEPSVFYEISKGVLNFATDEGPPILMQVTGEF